MLTSDLSGATAYLLREVGEAGDAVRADRLEGLVRLPLLGLPGVEGELFVQAKDPVDPPWVSFLEGAARAELPSVPYQQSGALMVFRVEDSWLALAFGLGRHLLDRNRMVPDFGLKVALNVIDPERVRSLDARAYEQIVVLTRRQGSRGSRAEDLGLDVSREMLRSVTGAPLNRDDIVRVHGSDSLVMTGSIALPELTAKAADWVALYGSDQYRQRFRHVDRVRFVSDRQLIAELDASLVSALRSPVLNIEPPYLAEPTIVDFGRIDGYRYTNEPGSQTPHAELNLDDYLATLPEAAEPDIEALKRHEVRLIGSDNSTVHSWSVYETLVYEIPRDGVVYALSEGQWSRIDPDVLRRVNERVAAITRSAIALPSARATEDEVTYNRRAADENGWLFLDRDLARLMTERGPVEVCDLFTPERQFVHVKRGFAASAVSHLLNQGLTSAELFRNLPEFRTLVREKFESIQTGSGAIVPPSRPDRDAFEVVYAVLTPQPDRVPADLPFFAKWNLARVADLLENLDYRVSVIGVMRA